MVYSRDTEQALRRLFLIGGGGGGGAIFFKIWHFSDRLSVRNDVTPDKLDFRPDMRRNFLLKKNEDFKSLCVS